MLGRSYEQSRTPRYMAFFSLDLFGPDRFGFGDIVLVRTGQMSTVGDFASWRAFQGKEAGLHWETAAWLHRRRVAAVAADNSMVEATGQLAESKGIPWVGYDSNAQKFAPKSWLTAALYDWGVYYKLRVKQAMDGTWKPGFWYGDIKDGFTMLAPYGPKVDAATKAKITAKLKAMENGSFNVFSGPLYDQSGKLRVPKGQTMQLLKGGTNSLYGMNWLVKGVIGSPTGK